MSKKALFLLLLLSSAKSLSHPMGNFSVNRWTRLSPRPGTIDVTHVIDLAEIPTQKLLSESNLTSAPSGEALARMRDALAARFLPGLVLTVGGARVALAVVRSALEFAPGVADLPTARLTLDLEAIVSKEGALAVTFSDTNFEGRAGWKEVIAQAGKGAALLAADVPATDRSRQLTQYPSDPAEPPSEVTRANLRVRFGAESVRKGASLPSEESVVSTAMLHLTTSADVVVSGKRAFRGLDDPGTTLDVFNVLDSKASDVDYFYASRLPGEPADGMSDIHFHPVDR